MKPTQEQVIAWAKKADFSDYEIRTCFDGFILLAELAYEAGRKDENEAMVQDGWRQCAVGQRTTQFCGLLHEAVAAEREACAAICDHEMDNAIKPAMQIAAGNCADKIRARREQ